jgi:hypothetical protein
VETDPTVMCQLLAGLPTATVLGVVDEGVVPPLMVHIETVIEQLERCAGCAVAGGPGSRTAIG